MPVPDAAGDAGSVDAPTSWDSSGNSVKADLVTVGDGGCGPDVNPYVLPALAEVNEIYGVCDFPTGLRTETTWMRDLTTTGNLLLVDAYTCVADDDPRVWSATGAQFKIILSESQHSFAYRGPYRIYAIFQDHGASEVRAAYDLSVTLDDGEYCRRLSQSTTRGWTSSVATRTRSRHSRVGRDELGCPRPRCRSPTATRRRE